MTLSIAMGGYRSPCSSVRWRTIAKPRPMPHVIGSPGLCLAKSFKTQGKNQDQCQCRCRALPIPQLFRPPELHVNITVARGELDGVRSKFQIICCNLADRRTPGQLGLDRNLIKTPRALAAGRTISTAASINADRSTGCMSSCSFLRNWDIDQIFDQLACARASRSTVSSACFDVSSSRPTAQHR